MYFIAYNLIRCVMAEAAMIHYTSLERISFKGAVDTIRQYNIVLAHSSRFIERTKTVQGSGIIAHEPSLTDSLAAEKREKGPTRS